MYCSYCGRVTHRCQCIDPNSDLERFLLRGNRGKPVPRWQISPYKRAVPPQVKRRERTILNRRRAAWRTELVARYGERCLNCGHSNPEELVLDHILPVARGGHSEPENLQLLCRECNRLKGKLVIDCRSNV